MHIKVLIAFLLFTTFATTIFGSINGYICSGIRKKFLDVATRALKSESSDLSNHYYGAKSFKLLNEPVPKDLKTTACAYLKKSYKADLGLEVIYNAISAWSLLQCEGKLHSDALIKDLKTTLESEKSTIPELRYAADILNLVGQSLPNSAKVAQLIQAKLKVDDNLQNLGQALHVALLLGNDGKFINDRVEDIIVQADEVDNKLLQWEGGLSTTSLLLTGLLNLQGVNTLNQEQADKVANYLLTRSTVQTPKGTSALLEALTALVNSKLSPVSISVVGSSNVTPQNSNLKIQVSNIFGQPLKPALSPVVAQSATRIVDDVVVLAKQPLSVGTQPTEYVLPLKLEPDYYRIVLNVGPHAATINTRVLGSIEVKSFEIGVTDSDGSSAPKLSKVTYPSKLAEKLQGDGGQQLQVKFGLSLPVHQAFVRLFSKSKEIIFVAEQESPKVYKVDVNLGEELAASGVYDVELIIGDAIISNPFRWTVATLDVNLARSADTSPLKIQKGPKPEIKHMFRPAEKRPAKTVSLLFTALTAVPFLILLILWGKIGVNFDNFTAISLPFHFGFASILGLFTLFWLKLDMFTTCAWLIPLGAFTFLAGQKMLSHMAKKRRPEKSEK